jgi:hypothetical protein
MEQGTQWGNFVELNPIGNPINEQIGASTVLLTELNNWFEKEEFKGLGLHDFKVELIFREPNDRYPGGTVGLKLTKK